MHIDTSNMTYEKYDSIYEFQDTVYGRYKRGEWNKIFRGKNSVGAELGDENKIRLTNSIEDAMELMRYGYSDVVNDLSGKRADIENMRVVKKRLVEVGVVGFAPHVANAVIGLPRSMISKKDIAGKMRVISIAYSPNVSGGTSGQIVKKAGRNIIEAIKMIEAAGHRVALSVLLSSCSGGNTNVLKVKVKDWRDNLNLLKIAYPLAHPSMQRRHKFLWLETVPGLDEYGYVGTYGRSHTSLWDGSEDIARKEFREAGILDEDEYWTSAYEAIEYKGNELIEKMGIKIKMGE